MDLREDVEDLTAKLARELGFTHVIHHHETSAAQAAAAAPTPTEEHMSLATLEEDLGNGVAAVKAEIARFEQNLPGYVADVRKIAGSPLGQLAVTAAEHVAAGILPPEALAVVESGAAKLFGDILSLYNPQGAQAPQQAAPGAQ